MASMDSAESDRSLVAAFLRDRGEAAFRQLYRRHAPRMLGLGRRLAAGSAVSAEDAVQEAWIRAVRTLDRFEWRSSLGSWLGGILVNVVREERRRAGPQGGAEAGAETGIAEGSGWVDPIDGIRLAESLRNLPLGFRSVVTLHDIAGFTHGEIAEMLGIDVGTSKSQLARGRQRLRRALGAEPEQEGG